MSAILIQPNGYTYMLDAPAQIIDGVIRSTWTQQYAPDVHVVVAYVESRPLSGTEYTAEVVYPQGLPVDSVTPVPEPRDSFAVLAVVLMMLLVRRFGGIE